MTQRMPDQRSLYDQMLDLVRLANKEGLYDAADWVQAQISTWPCARPSDLPGRADAAR